MKKLNYSDDALERFRKSDEWKMLKEIIEDKVRVLETGVFGAGKDNFDYYRGCRDQMLSLINFIDKRTKPPQNV